MTNNLIYNILFFTVIIIFATQSVASDSCRGLCCQGKNSSCYAIRLSSRDKCFCDTSCVRSRDCCSDYHTVCKWVPPINCILSNWQRWTHCSRKCGTGLQQRSRKILILPNSAGRRCGKLSESRQCEGVLCPAQSQGYKYKKTIAHSKAMTSVVQILPDLKNPSMLYRRYSHKYGIRRHMYLRDLWLNNITEVQNKKQPYCSFYQITMTLGKCQSLHKLTTIERANWSEHAMYLTDSNNICVTCYPQNQHNNPKNQCHGSGHRESRWRAVRSDNCHGYFKLISRQEHCKCQPPSFLMI